MKEAVQVAGAAPIVLIVDDNAMNREVISELLGAYNCQVIEAHDGFEALRALE
jgi:CheY-like chemotaxis protein